MLKVGIYNPYMHILGGAEKYALTIAACLEKEYQVTLFTNNRDIINQAQKKFGIKLINIKICPWPNFLTRRVILSKLDWLFYLTDGSLFFSPAKQNILIIQSPVHIPVKTPINRLKLKMWHKIICYSDFMAKIIIKRLGRQAYPLFVPIESVSIKPETTKDNLILSVGRFFPHLHNKKQLEMVQIFKQMMSSDLKDTHLILVGSVDPGGEKYLDQVKREAVGYPIQIMTQVHFSDLQKLYHRAKIYWHATGFGENLTDHPEKAEHFGVVTLEAMAYGTVPIVFKAGGQTEIVSHDYNGFTWETKEELIKYTRKLLESDNLRAKLSHKAIETAKEFTQEKFCELLHEIVKI